MGQDYSTWSVVRLPVLQGHCSVWLMWYLQHRWRLRRLWPVLSLNTVTCSCLVEGVVEGVRDERKFAVKNEKSVGGDSGLHLTRASSVPGPWPGFPYFELSDVSPMKKKLATTTKARCLGDVVMVVCRDFNHFHARSVRSLQVLIGL